MVLCFEKGRSSRPGLNRLCRVAGAFQAGLGIRWRLRRVETKRNAADSPSRRFEKSQNGSVLRRGFTSQLHPEGGEVDKKTKNADDHLDCHCEVHGHPIVQLNLFDIWHGQEQAAQRGRCRGVRGCGRCEADMSFLGHTSPASPSTSSTSWRANPKAPGLYKRGVFWEVFSGSGRLTQAISAEGLCTLPTIDVKKGCAFDLSRRSTQILIKQLILEEKVSFLHLGTPCIVFSNARRNIRNLIRARARERVGCKLAFFSAELARLCHRRQTQWSIENPASSRLWQFPAIEELMLLPGVRSISLIVVMELNTRSRPCCLQTASFLMICSALVHINDIRQCSKDGNSNNRTAKLSGLMPLNLQVLIRLTFARPGLKQ